MRETSENGALAGNERAACSGSGQYTVLRRWSMMRPKHFPLDLAAVALGCLDRSCLGVMGRYSFGGRRGQEKMGHEEAMRSSTINFQLF